MSNLSVGIVGLTNVGKSTLYNELTDNDVLAANYPFATIGQFLFLALFVFAAK